MIFRQERRWIVTRHLFIFLAKLWIGISFSEGFLENGDTFPGHAWRPDEGLSGDSERCNNTTLRSRSDFARVSISGTFGKSWCLSPLGTSTLPATSDEYSSRVPKTAAMDDFDASRDQPLLKYLLKLRAERRLEIKNGLDVALQTFAIVGIDIQFGVLGFSE